jgi:hypothetical protein
VSCDAGICVIQSCEQGYKDCYADPGCESQIGTPTACSDCGHDCTALSHVKDVSCISDACVINTCQDGFGNCNDAVGDGCETRLNTLTDCGACRKACGPLDYATATCASGTCQIETCAKDYDDCNTDASDGCEQSLKVPVHCGACDAVCTVDNATAGCSTGICEIASCNNGFDDCNESATDGCEIDLRIDPYHCDSCDNACGPYDHADPICVDRNCGMQCHDDYDDCNESATDGCETEIGTETDCSGCGDSCLGFPGVGSVQCQSGSCVITGCTGTLADCDGVAASGCEHDLNDGPCFINFSYSPGNFDPYILNPGSAPIVILDCAAIYDSGNPGDFSSWCGQPAPLVEIDTAPDPDVVILTMQTFAVTGTGSLTIEGDKPVILAVFGDATVDGNIDAGAVGTAAGPGGDVACSGGAGDNGGSSNSDNDGSGGGGGGGFGSPGARGGSGSDGGGGNGGSTDGNPELVPLRGGCSGGRGGRGVGSGRYGGGGGGAAQVSTAGILSITGTVSAAGGGGQKGGGYGDGGGGGGSGGAVLLEGDTVSIDAGAWLTANGGGGGGGRGEGGGSSQDGSDGYRSSTARAPGGNCAGSQCGDGGDGAAAAGSAQNGQNGDDGGGGGGGGGMGRVRINSPNACTLNGNISAVLTTNGCDT